VSRTVSAKNRFLWLGLLLSFITFMHAVTAIAGTITLAWDASTTNTDGTPLTDLAGYKIYYGPTSGSYTNTLDVGDVTTSEVNKLTDGLTYYFAVSAYNSAGAESSFSNEVSKTLPPPQLILTTFMITATADIGGTIAASFAINTYTITASAGTGGAISPSGAVSANYGGNAFFSITPNTGYNTTDVTVDGVSKGAVATYTFTNVTAAHTIAATFTQNPSSTITASAGLNGSISPSGSVSVPSNRSQTFTITASPGYRIAYVAVNGASVSLAADNTYTFTNVRMNYTLLASFVPINYAITVMQTANGAITPDTYSNFQAGANQTYAIAPSLGYHVESLTVDGNAVNPPVTSYPFTNIQANHTITATFAPNPTYTITATASANGSISPGTTSLLGGQSQKLTITAASGYRIDKVRVDNVDKGAVTTYTFNTIDANHTIDARFVPDTYTITAMAGTGGSISPSGATPVAGGGSQTFTITASPGYRIAYVAVNGASVGSLTSYTFTNVRMNYTILASFVPVT
jgi:hypothetical protein